MIYLLSAESSSSSTTQSQTQEQPSQVPVVLSRVIAGSVPIPGGSTVRTLPAGALVWRSFALDRQAFVSSVAAELEIYPESYGSAVSVMLYVDGKLSYQTSYAIAPPPSAPGRTVQVTNITETFPLVVGFTFGQGTELAIAVSSTASFHPLSVAGGSTLEFQGSSYANILPTSPSATLPWSIAVWAQGS